MIMEGTPPLDGASPTQPFNAVSMLKSKMPCPYGGILAARGTGKATVFKRKGYTNNLIVSANDKVNGFMKKLFFLRPP